MTADEAIQLALAAGLSIVHLAQVTPEGQWQCSTRNDNYGWSIGFGDSPGEAIAAAVQSARGYGAANDSAPREAVVARAAGVFE